MLAPSGLPVAAGDREGVISAFPAIRAPRYDCCAGFSLYASFTGPSPLSPTVLRCDCGRSAAPLGAARLAEIPRAIGEIDGRAPRRARKNLAFAEVALGQIRALGQPASPRNFEIWYHYATGYNQTLNQTINETLAKKGALERSRSRADLRHLYRRQPPGRPDRFGQHAACSTKSSRSCARSTPPPARRPSYSKALESGEPKSSRKPMTARRCAGSSSTWSRAPRRWSSTTRSSNRGLRRRGRKSSSFSKISKPCAPKA